MARVTTFWVISSASSTHRNSLSSLQDNWKKRAWMFHRVRNNNNSFIWCVAPSFHAHCKHLHEELLLLLLGLVLSVLIHLVATGGQEAVVVVEEDWTPELLLQDSREGQAEVWGFDYFVTKQAVDIINTPEYGLFWNHELKIYRRLTVNQTRLLHVYKEVSQYSKN